MFGWANSPVVPVLFIVLFIIWILTGEPNIIPILLIFFLILIIHTVWLSSTDSQTKTLPRWAFVSTVIIVVFIIPRMSIDVISTAVSPIFFLALTIGWFILTYWKTRSIKPSILSSGAAGGALFLGIFFFILLGSVNISSPTITMTGFAKIKPQLAATGISHTGQPLMIFTNGYNTPITIKGAKIIDAHNPTTSCTLTGAAFIPNNVASYNENTKLSTAETNCIAHGDVGSVYNAKVTITYDVTVNDVTVTREESGTLRGPYE